MTLSDTSTVIGFHGDDYKSEREMTSQIVIPIKKRMNTRCIALDMIHASGQIVISVSKIVIGDDEEDRNGTKQNDNGRVIYIQTEPLGIIKNRLYINPFQDIRINSTEGLMNGVHVTLTVTDVPREGNYITAAFDNLHQCPEVSANCKTGIYKSFT